MKIGEYATMIIPTWMVVTFFALWGINTIGAVWSHLVALKVAKLNNDTTRRLGPI